MRVAITGASGFLGLPLTRRLLADGHEVVALVRDPAAMADRVAGVATARCDLPTVLDDAALDGVETIVHAAWPTRETDRGRAKAAAEDGTRRVIDVARERGARVVFISSIAARADAPARYGRSKHAAELALDLARDAIVRPGLIVAAEGHGLFQQLRQAAARLHLVPLFGGGRQPLQTVHVADVCEAVSRVVARRLTGAFDVAEPDPVDLGTFLRMMTRAMGVRCLFVPVPFAPVLAAVRVVERLGLPLPLRSESLLGMQGMRRIDVADSLRRLDMTVRPAADTLRDVLG